MEMTKYICVLDFEATCDDKQRWTHEIIEFPSVLLEWSDIHSKYIQKSEIQIYCKPVEHPILTDFCTKLTGITQKQVDRGIPLSKAIKDHYMWLLAELSDVELGDAGMGQVMIATWGDWDLNIMLKTECKRKGINVPKIYTKYYNVKRLFSEVFKVKKQGMAEALGMCRLPLVGRHHSGIDDCRNICTLINVLASKGLSFNQEHVLRTTTYYVSCKILTVSIISLLFSLMAARLFAWNTFSITY